MGGLPVVYSIAAGTTSTNNTSRISSDDKDFLEKSIASAGKEP